MRKGKPVAWLHRSVAPTIMSTFDADAKQEANWELGMGVINVPVRHSQHPHRESGSDRAHAHRLVPLGVEHSARIRGAVVRRGARRRGGPRPEGLPARGDRTARGSCRRRCWATRGTTANRPSAIRSTPAACGASPSSPRKRRGWGRSMPKGSGLGIAAHYSFVSYVAAVVRGRGRRQGRVDDSARGHRGRLRRDGQSRIACARRWRARASWA